MRWRFGPGLIRKQVRVMDIERIQAVRNRYDYGWEIRLTPHGWSYNRVRNLIDLAVSPRNRLEPLGGDRSGQHSLRINDQYRICFRREAGDAYEVEITGYD